MKNFGNIMKQAQKMQEKMEEAQAKLGTLEIEGSSGSGMVKVVLNGHGTLKKITINPSIVDSDDTEMLEDLIIAAFNDGKKKVDEEVEAIMSKVTGGYGGMPGGLNLPF